MITFRSSAKFDKKAALILISKEQLKNKKFSFADKPLKDQVVSLGQSDYFSGEDGQVFPLASGKNIVLLVGIGAQKDLSLTALRITVRKALLSPSLSKIKDLEC